MNQTIDDRTRSPRTNKITTTLAIAGISLLIGLALGAAAAETGTGLLTKHAPTAVAPAHPKTTGAADNLTPTEQPFAGTPGPSVFQTA